MLNRGQPPFHWLEPSEVGPRRRRGGRSGLLGLNTLDAAEADDVPLTWRLADASVEQLAALEAVMRRCLSKEPHDRPHLADIQLQLQRAVRGDPSTSASGREDGGGDASTWPRPAY